MSEPEGLFSRRLSSIDLPALSRLAREASFRDVTVALGIDIPGLDHVAALLSPPGAERVEEISERARQETIRRFGRLIRLFAPLYVSNACLSTCAYCGFAKNLSVVRRTLTPNEVLAEARVLLGRGLRDVLLVSGEHRIEVSPDYLITCARLLHSTVPSLSIETQTWSDDTYVRLRALGVAGVVHYQETYDRARYRQVHQAGWKRDFNRRLSAVERAAGAGIGCVQ